MSAVLREHLVAVAPGPFARGVGGPECDWRTENDGKVRATYEVLDLESALQRHHKVDAHLVTYIVRNGDGTPLAAQPRINKPGLPWLREQGFHVDVSMFFCDADNPDHAPWDDRLLAAALERYATVPALQTAGIYHTAHGARFIQLLSRPLPVEYAEARLRAWLLSLEQAGVQVDWACRDWTRHYRLPHVKRGGRPYRSPYVRLDCMSAISVPVEVETPSGPAPKGATPRPHVSLPMTLAHLPDFWQARAATLAQAIRETVGSNWHDMYLALGGALLGRGVPGERVPQLLERIAELAGSVKPWSHGRSAEDTVRNFLGDRPVTGFRTLSTRWPGVAAALDEVTAVRAERSLRSQVCENLTRPPPPSLAEAAVALEDAFRHAPDGLSVISAECGLGKTQAAMKVALERSQRPYATNQAQGIRAPLQSKTSLSVDKHKLALQVTSDLRAAGATVLRVFGPLSLLHDDGEPVCHFYDVARPLADGAQSVQREFCEGRGIERCPFYKACPARLGQEGPPEARITVGPHALLRQLDGEAGTTGLLIIDEPPPLLESLFFTADQFATAIRTLSSFEGRYHWGMLPALHAFQGWLGAGEQGVVLTPRECLGRTVAHVAPATLAAARRATKTKATGDPVTDILACVEASVEEERTSTAPPLRRSSVHLAKGNVSIAKELGAVSKLLFTVFRACTTKDRAGLRIEERGADVALVFTIPGAALSDALKREGSVVVSDANAELHVPEYATVVGYTPPLKHFGAVDGSPIARTLVARRQCTRRGWFAHGKLVLNTGVADALRTVVDWALEDPEARSLGLITMRTVRLAIEATLHPDDETPAREWKEAGQDADTLVKARAALGPILARFPGTLVLGHYGAVRGLNSMSDVDCLATLGDPRPNMGDVANDAAYLGLPDDGEARTEALCVAELEQAQGRIRAVHRTRRGRALHVGMVLPGGSGWRSGNVEVRTPPKGRPCRSGHMTTEEVGDIVGKLGGVRSTARALSCSPAAVSAYGTGARPVPDAVASRLRAFAAKTEAHESTLLAAGSSWAREWHTEHAVPVPP